MADHGVLLKNMCASTDVNAWIRSAMAGSAVDLDNGNVFRLDTQNTASTRGYEEAWDVSAPSLSGSTLGNLWMAAQPERNLTIDGSLQYAGLNDDPRKFYNPGAKVFTAIKPQVGDIVTMTGDCFSNAIGGNTFANASDASYELTWGATQTANALSFGLIATTYISIGSGAIDTQRVVAYKLVCLAN
jgi:hypothetical protein